MDVVTLSIASLPICEYSIIHLYKIYWSYYDNVIVYHGICSQFQNYTPKHAMSDCVCVNMLNCLCARMRV